MPLGISHSHPHLCLIWESTGWNLSDFQIPGNKIIGGFDQHLLPEAVKGPLLKTVQFRSLSVCPTRACCLFPSSAIAQGSLGWRWGLCLWRCPMPPQIWPCFMSGPFDASCLPLSFLWCPLYPFLSLPLRAWNGPLQPRCWFGIWEQEQGYDLLVS